MRTHSSPCALTTRGRCSVTAFLDSRAPALDDDDTDTEHCSYVLASGFGLGLGTRIGSEAGRGRRD